MTRELALCQLRRKKKPRWNGGVNRGCEVWLGFGAVAIGHGGIVALLHDVVELFGQVPAGR